MYLLFAAALLGLAVLVGAFTFPVVTAQSSSTTVPLGTSGLTPLPRETAYAHLGLHGALIAAAPIASALVVSGLLWISAATRRRLFLVMAWAVSLALLAAGLVGFVTFLIGIVAVPTGALLVVACSRMPRLARRAA